jgi:sugar phosphate isomerase/epimerase
MTLESFMQRCSDMDLDGVELTAYYFESTEDRYLNRLKAQACKLGLHISGAAVGNNFCQPDPAQRAAQVADVKKWTDVAYRLGAPCLRVFAGPAPKGHTDEECMGWVVRCLQECAEYAAPRGVILALENHGGVTTRAEQVLSLIRDVGSEWVRVNLDTGNYRTDPYREIAETVPFAAMAHVKTETRTPDGQKEILDYTKIIETLKTAGFRGYLDIEYEAAEDPMTAVPRFARELLRLTGRP